MKKWGAGLNWAVLAGMLLALAFLPGCGNKTNSTDCIASFINESTSIAITNPNFGGSSVAESFQASSTTPFTTVGIKLVKVDPAPAQLGNHTLTMTIQTSSNNAPSGTSLGSASINTDTINTGTSNFYYFTLSSAIALSTGTTYWIVVTPNYGSSSTNYISWFGFSGTTGGYSSGNAAYQTNSGSYSTAQIGSSTALEFKVGC